MYGLKNDFQTLHNTIDNLAAELTAWINRHGSNEEKDNISYAESLIEDAKYRLEELRKIIDSIS